MLSLAAKQVEANEAKMAEDRIKPEKTEVIIGKGGKPVAKLVRYERVAEPRRPGALRGKIKIADDFDELPDDIARAFGMMDS